MTTLLERPVGALRRRRRPQPVGAKSPTPGTPPSTPTPTTSADRGALFVSTTAVMCLLVIGWMLLQMLFLGGLTQDRTQDRLYAQLRTELASGIAPMGPVTEVGHPVALLSIPHLEYQQVVVEGTASGDMLAGPGHLRNTVLPGQEGTSAIFGRASTYGGPFRGFGDLRKGQQIVVTMAQGTKTFKVLGVRRTGDPLPQPRPEGAARLVLVTAEGSGRLPSLSPSDVIYVDAEAKKALPAPAGVPASVPDSEQAMGAESGAVTPLLALCLGLLVAMTYAVIAARQHFNHALVWVITTPVVLAVAWVTTDVVMRLLPNLM